MSEQIKLMLDKCIQENKQLKARIKELEDPSRYTSDAAKAKQVKVSINGHRFDSQGAAAVYIVEQEKQNNVCKSKATVAKEISKAVNGLRADILYGKYLVEKVSNG